MLIFPNFVFETLNLVTPLAVFFIFFLTSSLLNKYFKKFGEYNFLLVNLKPKQKLFRYIFSFILSTTTEENPHSSGVSLEPVKRTSPYSILFCFSSSSP